MADIEKRITQLHRLRGALKTKATILEKFLNKPIEDINIIELKGKIENTSIIFENFEKAQCELEENVAEDELESEYQWRSDFEEKFSALCAKAQGILNEKEYGSSENLLSAQPPSRNSVENVFNENNAAAATIGVQQPNVNRFLRPMAGDKIQYIQTTDANYKVAWNILEKCYDDPSTVINNHIKSFFELPNCHNASAVALGEHLNNVTKHYRALEALKKPFLEAFPIYAIVSKLDPQIRLKWKEHLQANNAPTMEQLLDFLHNRERILETNKFFSKNEKSERNITRSENHSYGGNRPPHSQSNFKRQSVYSIQNRAFSHICKETHFTQNCEKLLNATLQERFSIVKHLHLCFNCLRSNHTVENYIATTCKTCSKRHHTLLHQDNKTTKPLQANHAHLHNTVSSQVLLSMAIVHILDHKGNPQACRALLDNGSQVHFIIEKLAAKLGLEQREIEIPLGGVNQMSSSVSKITRTTIQSRLNKYSADLTFLITPEVNDHAPSEPLNRIELKIPPKLHLADPEFHKPSEIDILIETHFGNIFPHAAKCNLSLNLLHNKISEFWEIENGPNEKLLSNEENAYEVHVQENTRRDHETGSYIVKLPFKEDSPVLSESYSQALRRFNSLERSLAKNSHLKDKYIAFMRDYIELDHMSEDESASIYDGYFLPHHAVIKQSSLTTKLRSVFDASAKTSNGKSLNNVLMGGPNIQNDIFSLLVRLRSNTYAITADNEKMYQQIRLDEADQNFQKILWREESREPLKIYKLKTVTYGMSSASFLATRSLRQLANDEARNRVEEIQTLTQSLEWRHVRTEHNPADFVSRGLTPKEFIASSLWFNGPAWINDPEENCPQSHLQPIEISERRKPVISLSVKLTRHFIPPRSPHFGGLWEAAVKSFKHHWVHVIGDRLLTYEEFTTLATEIEGILNSRPLTPVPSDPNDLAALTPGHFLTGDSLTAVPEHYLKDLPSGRLSSWQQVQQMKQHFWTRWSKEYLHELTVRKKWHKGATTDIQIGKLVTMRDDNLPPMRWTLGRVIATHPGEDGVIRVVTVKTANGDCKRSVKNLSPLPIDTH
ncbi:uncharacterized protein LOC117171090 [Belonocnema kinseyi]|uniref:uncharacterized protein LOC117171090 n=1 Tax=Belonocnema kinseyi TaxID=2817044 RepID=UPI00143CE174|nr:uncharacterized protein LOC117171090 [Belonocnema kinseyi]